MKIQTPHLLLTLLIMATASVIAQPAYATINLHQQHLKNLSSNSHYNTQQLKGSPSLWIIFQPECRWCHLQVKSINAVQSSCKIQALAIGANAGRRRLQQELRHLKPDFQAVEISNELKTELGKHIPSPLTLAINPNGSIAGVIRGYLSTKQLTEQLNTLNLCMD